MKMYKYEKLFNRDVKNLINKNLNVVMETIMFTYMYVQWTIDDKEFLKLLQTMKSTLVYSKYTLFMRIRVHSSK